jgi:hypothetical protein
VLLLYCAVPTSAHAADRQSGGAASAAISTQHPVLRIPLRIHLGKSAWRPVDFVPVAEEISGIWLTQAGICFETEIVLHDLTEDAGFDLWFEPVLKERPAFNGLFNDEHDIHVRDVPILDPAKSPAQSPTARTAAHEMGHALGLRHRQDSNENLMRSKTYGWQLNEDEIRRARMAAEKKALPDRKPVQCAVEITY